ncbi:hypothetical protein L6019_RS23735 [Escherichia coli]|nr:hypothetical protein [Escherichia coli]EKG7113562.1 hypothetical protein [Escherichia coli]ELM8776626.1 hypothetical protein [Escherichia coli]EMA4402891.1 hypothetical protein [Escherichia coli]HAH8500984.1 hypothetical protein [Escherichia coli]
MTTLHDTIKPDEAYLSGFMDEALDGRNEAQYVDEYLTVLASRLKDDPCCYRSFGPFWPAVKAMLLERGCKDIGYEVDGPVAALYSYEEEALTLIAATLYSLERLENGSFYVSEHMLPTSGDEAYPYYSEDDEIELRVSK